MTTLERAYQLARSGAYLGAAEIEKILEREGYEAVRGHLAGPSIRKQIKELCRQSRRDRAGQQAVAP